MADRWGLCQLFAKTFRAAVPVINRDNPSRFKLNPRHVAEANVNVFTVFARLALLQRNSNQALRRRHPGAARETFLSGAPESYRTYTAPLSPQSLLSQDLARRILQGWPTGLVVPSVQYQSVTEEIGTE